MNTLRLVTLNLWGEQPPYAARMRRCEAELLALQPDVVALQEVRQVEGQVPNQAQALAAALQLRYLFAPTVEWGGGLEGLGLLSRLPLVDSGHAELPHATDKERRIVLWAFLQAPAGLVGVFCTHLNYRQRHGVQREDQVEAIDRTIEQLTERHRPLATLLCGDFNATPDSDEIRFLRGLHSLRGRRTYYQDAYALRHGTDPGYTWARRNPCTQRMHWLEPDRRLDYIFVSEANRDGRGLVRECRIVLDTADADGVYPSDHFGVLAEVQVAPGA